MWIATCFRTITGGCIRVGGSRRRLVMTTNKAQALSDDTARPLDWALHDLATTWEFNSSSSSSYSTAIDIQSILRDRALPPAPCSPYIIPRPHSFQRAT
jgi:hypothetical protein